MSKPVIRPARVEDAGLLRQMEEECFPDPWSRESLLSELASDLSVIRIAEQDGAAQGYFIARIVLGEGELLRIAVRRDARLKGLGKSLARDMLAGLLGVSVWRLDVRESNLAARKLYEGLGFRNVIRRRGYYENPSEDGIMMMLER